MDIKESKKNSFRTNLSCLLLLGGLKIFPLWNVIACEVWRVAGRCKTRHPAADIRLNTDSTLDTSKTRSLLFMSHTICKCSNHLAKKYAILHIRSPEYNVNGFFWVYLLKKLTDPYADIYKHSRQEKNCKTLFDQYGIGSFSWFWFIIHVPSGNPSDDKAWRYGDLPQGADPSPPPPFLYARKGR